MKLIQTVCLIVMATAAVLYIDKMVSHYLFYGGF